MRRRSRLFGSFGQTGCLGLACPRANPLDGFEYFISAVCDENDFLEREQTGRSLFDARVIVDCRHLIGVLIVGWVFCLGSIIPQSDSDTRNATDPRGFRSSHTGKQRVNVGFVSTTKLEDGPAGDYSLRLTDD